MSEPKCGLLGNVWLDNTTSEALVYTPDTSNKKAVGTVTINVSGSDHYYNAGPWNSTSIYQENAIVKFSGLLFKCINQSAGNPPPNATFWQHYVPQFVEINVVNKSHTGFLNKANSDKFMTVFKALVNPWDGAVMIPGLVISAQNKLVANVVVDQQDYVTIGFNGIEEYL